MCRDLRGLKRIDKCMETIKTLQDSYIFLHQVNHSSLTVRQMNKIYQAIEEGKHKELTISDIHEMGRPRNVILKRKKREEKERAAIIAQVALRHRIEQAQKDRAS